MKLSPDEETVAIPIRAREPWNDTQIDMDVGERYLLTASGRWVDFFIPCSPYGYLPPLSSIVSLDRLLRHPGGNFFSLISCLDRCHERQFLIGKMTAFNPEVNGRLFCFANDVPGFYWNNWGYIALTVKRIG